MLTIETLNNLTNILTSDALTIKGNNLLAVVNVLNEIDQERKRLQASQRLAIVPTGRVREASPQEVPSNSPYSPAEDQAAAR